MTGKGFKCPPPLPQKNNNPPQPNPPPPKKKFACSCIIGLNCAICFQIRKVKDFVYFCEIAKVVLFLMSYIHVPPM